jgi:hypothetical protein
VYQDLPWDVDASVTAQGLYTDPCDGWSYSLNIRQPYSTQADSAFYSLKVFNNHLWLLGRYDKHQTVGQALAYGNLNQSFDIHQTNVIRLVVVGQHFDFYLNDQKIGSGDDPDAVSYPTGYGVGVSVETCSGPVSALFTNLLVLTTS